MTRRDENALERIYIPVIRRILDLEVGRRKFKHQYPKLYNFAQNHKNKGTQALIAFLEKEGKTDISKIIGELNLIDVYLNYTQLPFPAINISRLRLSNHGIDTKNFITFLESSRINFQKILYEHFPPECKDAIREILTLHSLSDVTSINSLDNLIFNCSLIQGYIENYQEAHTVKNYLHCKDVLDFLFNCKTPSNSSMMASFIETNVFTINRQTQHYISLNLKCLEQAENLPNLLINFMLSYMNENLAFLEQVQEQTPDDMLDYYKNGLIQADEVIKALDSVNNLRSKFKSYTSFIPTLIALKCWDNLQEFSSTSKPTNTKIAEITLLQITDLFKTQIAMLDKADHEYNKRRSFLQDKLDSFTVNNIRTHFGKFLKNHFLKTIPHMDL